MKVSLGGGFKPVALSGLMGLLRGCEPLALVSRYRAMPAGGRRSEPYTS